VKCVVEDDLLLMIVDLGSVLVSVNVVLYFHEYMGDSDSYIQTTTTPQHRHTRI
jgi:hypothetical protein